MDSFMKKRIHKLLAILLLYSVSSMAFSEEIMVRGFGTITCGEYSVETKGHKDMKLDAVNWGFGYMSYANRVSVFNRKEYKNIPGSNTTIAYLNKYCGDHPLARLYEAFDAMYSELKFVKYTGNITVK
jgi:hypothetical protein